MPGALAGAAAGAKVGTEAVSPAPVGDPWKAIPTKERSRAVTYLAVGQVAVLVGSREASQPGTLGTRCACGSEDAFGHPRRRITGRRQTQSPGQAFLTSRIETRPAGASDPPRSMSLC